MHNEIRWNLMRCTMKSTSASQTNGLKKFLLLTLFVFLLLPELSLAFFQFGDGAGGSDKTSVLSSNRDSVKEALKQAAKRRPIENKFKFHKLERVYIADEGDDDYEAGKDASNDDVDADIEADVDSAGDANAAESGQLNDEDELQFMRTHTTLKERRAATANSDKKQRISNKNQKQTRTSEDKSSESFFGALLGSLWSSEPKQQRVDRSAEDNSGEGEVVQTATNGIIDWLKWLGERSGQLRPQPAPSKPILAKQSWLDYLNRWPFNSFFPIGKPERPILMPRRSGNGIYSSENGNSAENVPAMSQEHFESVLHTLPGFVANPAHVSRHTECRQQLQVFHRQLRGNKLWTLQMLDATGKISSGLLRGNINQFGDFDLCAQVKTLVKVTPEVSLRIRGKYCLAHIEMQTSVPALKVPLHLAQGRGLWNSHLGNPSHFVPRYGVANWGVCIPHLCPAEVVRDMIETNLRPYNSTGVEFHVELDDADCYLRQSRKFTKLVKKDTKFALTCLYFAALTVLSLASLCCQYWSVIKNYLGSKLKPNESTESTESELNTETTTVEPEESSELGAASTSLESSEELVDYANKEQETTPTTLQLFVQQIFGCFSPQRTLLELIAPDRFEVQFPLFHVLKIGATFALYMCFKYLMIGHLPITNRDKLVRAIDQPTSILFRAPMLYMDVLLLISGFLGAYQLCEEMEQKSYIQLLKRVVLKVSRYLPTLYVVLFFQTWIMPHIGSGPLWTNLIGQNARICEQQMWRNAFSVQNAIDFEETCSPLTVQLALEVQLYLLGPLIVWLFYTDTDAAFFIYGGIHALSVGARFARTQREYLSMTLFHGMNVSKFYRTANLLFSSPISRATPYLLGIGAGVLHRSVAGTLDIAEELIPVGWLVVAVSLLWCFWSPASGMRMDFIYSSSEAASYAAWCPLILGLCVVWCIFMFPKSENSVLRFLTTTRPMLFLSRVTYPMQLMVYVVIMYNTASISETRKYHMGDLVNFNEIGVIIIFAVVLAFLIDIPSKQIRRLIINRFFTEHPHHEIDHEPSSGADTSEPELEDHSEQLTTEINDTIGDTIEGDSAFNDEVPDEDRNGKVAEDQVEIAEESESAEEAEVEAEEDTEIAEEDEIKKRPETPPEKESIEPSFRRRRRRISDD